MLVNMSPRCFSIAHHSQVVNLGLVFVCIMVKQLRVGSDFTGPAVGAIACRQAAQKICRQIVHTYSCDKSRASQKFVQHAFKAEVMQKNILERDLETCGPCDTFIWTAPCVTFSSLGNQKGMDSLTGTLAAFSLAYIRRWRPRTILSKNVATRSMYKQHRAFSELI